MREKVIFEKIFTRSFDLAYMNLRVIGKEKQTMDVDLKKVSTIVDKYQGAGGALIAILQDVQAEFNYLPADALKSVAEKLNVPLINVYSMATFYKSFSLKPRGKHLVTVCMGTACHVRGAPKILEEMERCLAIKNGDTTPDQNFTLETVNCLGCCAIGPVVVVDEEYYGQTTIAKSNAILDKYRSQ